MEEFLDQFNSYPLVQKILVFGIVVVALFLGFWFMLYNPVKESIRQEREELQKLIDQRQHFQQLKQSQAKVLDKVEELQAKIVIAEDKLPSSAQIPRLLKLIHEKAKTAGLEINNFERAGDKTEEYYIEIPVEMELKGTFGELVSFLQFVERMNRIVNFRNLSMTRSDGKGRGRVGELVVTATATTYRYKEDKETPKKK